MTSSKASITLKKDILASSNMLLIRKPKANSKGIKKIIDLLEEIPDVHFVILGEGEFGAKFKAFAESKSYSERIHFMGAVQHSELLKYTAGADLGLALIENISISYYYALPNKLFEYIMAGIPLLSSNLPQMKNIIDIYDVGRYVDAENIPDIILLLKEMLHDDALMETYRLNCYRAAKELNWENEFSKFKELIL